MALNPTKISHNKDQHGTRLNDSWLKAAVAGSLWASSEIILGSFLHNLHVPFSSILLTGIGLVLMIATSYRWSDRGLIWRAGLICALMKSVSPSAVILGPMIAILSQAFILEFFVRFLGRNIAGFLIGSIVAMSWNFIQKMINFVVYYGFTIVDLYEMMVKYAEKQLHITFYSVWAPLMVLWMVYFLAGSIAAVIGISLGRSSTIEFKRRASATAIPDERPDTSKTGPPFTYSLAWLIFSLAGIITVLVLMNYLSPAWWIVTGIALASTWVRRYRHTLHRLAKPKFWIFFIVITMLSGFLLSGAGKDAPSILPGLFEGFRMNFRAALMILGFSVIGKELRNPVIRSFFTRRSFKQIPLALEVSFAILPNIIASLPPLKEITRKPIYSLRSMISQADRWLDRVRVQLLQRHKVIMITGGKGEGKTTLVRQLSESLIKSGIPVAGFYSPAILTGGIKTGYSIVDVATGEQTMLARRAQLGECADIGEWIFLDTGLAMGFRALSIESGAAVVVIDEAGAWELSGGGWDEPITRLTLASEIPLVIAVNQKFSERIARYWSFYEPLMVHASTPVEDIIASITQFTGRSPDQGRSAEGDFFSEK